MKKTKKKVDSARKKTASVYSSKLAKNKKASKSTRAKKILLKSSKPSKRHKSVLASIADGPKMLKAALSFPELLSRIRGDKPVKSVNPATNAAIKIQVKEGPAVQTVLAQSKPVEVAAPVAPTEPPKFWSSPYIVDLKEAQSRKEDLAKPKSKAELIQNALQAALAAFNKQSDQKNKIVFPNDSFDSGDLKINLLSSSLPAAGQESDFKIVKAYLDAQNKPAPTAPRKQLRATLSFAIVAAIICLPFLAFAYYQNFQAKSKFLNEALDTLNSSNLALLEEKNSTADFDVAQQEIKNANDFLGQVAKEIPQFSSRLTGGYHLLSAGQKITQAAGLLKDGAKDIFAAQSDESLTAKLRTWVDRLSQSTPLLSKANKDLDGVWAGILPAAYQSQFTEVKEALPTVQKSLQRTLTIGDTLLEMLGENDQKRYLVVFQNNSEIRPTGGFIGSLALMDIYQGKIRNLEIPGGGPYDFKGSLLARVVSPQPLHLVNPVWQLQDANWFFDWPTSAKKITWFYQKSGGPSVDGVIAINTFVLRDILTVTGPIDMPEYGKTISADNFIDELQKSVEVDYQDPHKPKQIIADLAPKILKKIFDLQGDDYIKLAAILNQAAEHKDIMVSSNDTRVEAKISSLGWGGEIKDNGRDYLAVVDTNIAGGKTDSVVKESIRHQVDIQPDGQVIDNVIIQRTHTGVKGTPFTGIKNIDFMRVYVPLGSELIQANGFNAPADSYFQPVPDNYLPDPEWAPLEEASKVDTASGTRIYKENGKTVFGNWVQIDPGETATVSLKYKLPFTINFTQTKANWDWLEKIKGYLNMQSDQYSYYSLLIQKQSGSWDTSWQTQLNAPTSWEPVWNYPQDLKSSNGAEIQEGTLDTDKFYGVIFKKTANNLE